MGEQALLRAYQSLGAELSGLLRLPSKEMRAGLKHARKKVKPRFARALLEDVVHLMVEAARAEEGLHSSEHHVAPV